MKLPFSEMENLAEEQMIQSYASGMCLLDTPENVEICLSVYHLSIIYILISGKSSGLIINLRAVGI